MRSAMTCYVARPVESETFDKLKCVIFIIFRFWYSIYNVFLLHKTRVEHWSELNHMLHTTNANPFVDVRPTTTS